MSRCPPCFLSEAFPRGEQNATAHSPKHKDANQLPYGFCRFTTRREAVFHLNEHRFIRADRNDIDATITWTADMLYTVAAWLKQFC
jgi:hypothetical protein